RMTAMVNDLLDLARIESGQYVLHVSVFDINELIARTLLTFEARIDVGRVEISLDFFEDHCYVEADADQIAQILRNLIDNAIKFTPEGGRLTLSTLADKRLVQVRVADSGRGVAAEDIPYLFDRFYKAEKAHTPGAQSGTGLGLSIVKRIIDAHGQNVAVESELGRGTAFTFTLKRSEKPQQPTKLSQRRG
ncbi:MAG: HAMP domain-containing histidine kinase, partial [Clostridia bacterium]|nr:HAMP domain-containing histidine kinase [Clostridia bacterium]